MYRKILSLFVGIFILFSFIYVVNADGDVKVTFNGKQLNFDVAPIIIEGVTMLPLREVFEAFDASLEWDGSARKVIGAKGNTVIVLQIDNKIAKVNGKDVELDVPGTIVDGRTLVPVRFISESLGANIEWFSESRIVAIKYIEKGAIENIDYNNPAKYLASGKQTEISKALFNEINKILNIKTKELSDVKKVLDWKKNNFTNMINGGKSVGKSTVNEIIQNKVLTGSQDHAILTAAILREYGFPVILVGTVGIQFSLDYPEKANVFTGYTFIEVYLNNKWVLIDTTKGYYIPDYDPKNPVIPITYLNDYKGFYAMLKGLDPDDNGINDLKQTISKMIEYSTKIKNDLSLIKMPKYKINKF